MNRRLVVLTVVLAGCGGSAPSPPSPASPTPAPRVALGEPFDVLEEAGGTYLIADRTANAVYRLRGNALTTVAELPGPRDLEPAGDGRVLVASGRDVVELDPATGEVTTVATGRGEILGVARSRRGAIVFSDDGSRLVRVERGRRRVIATGLDGVHGLLWTPAGLVVCESGTGRVLLLAGARRRVLADGLDLPSFAAPAGDGALYVTEFGAGRIVRITRSGAVSEVAEMFRPTALSVTADGDLVVTGLDGEVARVDPATGQVTPLY